MHRHAQPHDQNGGTSSPVICWAFTLNVSFTLIEFMGTWLTYRSAIMADAEHDLGDGLAICSVWLLNKISVKQTDRYRS
jgi:cobalt-zinc-cadmium efflux system protein